MHYYSTVITIREDWCILNKKTDQFVDQRPHIKTCTLKYGILVPTNWNQGNNINKLNLPENGAEEIKKAK